MGVVYQVLEVVIAVVVLMDERVVNTVIVVSNAVAA